ncbi:acyl-CoA dehydrogenase family member 11 [Apiospora phragmitis]|uniref:Acyl-CoA dehydrogenase family member 11 n=1 Tax=Apiospora phragmitis TaxID=2905665 RepID=A0ABR1TQ34_9PEZI
MLTDQMLGEEVLQPHIFDCVTDAEKNLPYIRGSGKNAFGQPVSSELVLSAGWKTLQNLGFTKGFSAQGYEDGLGQYTRMVQYMRCLLWEASSAMTSCPMAMQDGAARLLQLQLAGDRPSPVERKVFQNALEHLNSRDPKRGWTSGQWMTERTGGSDVSQTETIATYSPLPIGEALCDPAEGIPLGPWSISGFKWFASAADSNMTILLAKTPKGLSAFYAPLRRFNPTLVRTALGDQGTAELNGVTISRLKNKMGTKPLPSAELVLDGMRGWLVGEEGRGIQTISTILTITRVRTNIGAMGFLGRGLAIVRAFTKVRVVGAGKGARIRLFDNALHMQTLSDMTIEYHGMMLLTFYSSYVMGLEEHADQSQSPPPAAVARITPQRESVTPPLRILTPVLKAYCTKQCIPLLYACMESMGGVGYLENSETGYLNIARLFRDACVLNIWEGTTDVLSVDLLRVLKHPQSGTASMVALDALINQAAGGEDVIMSKWRELRQLMEATVQADFLSQARDVLWAIAEILQAGLFCAEAEACPDQRTQEMCRRYLSKKRFKGESRMSEARDMRTVLRSNQEVVFGSDFEVPSPHSMLSSKM